MTDGWSNIGQGLAMVARTEQYVRQRMDYAEKARTRAVELQLQAQAQAQQAPRNQYEALGCYSADFLRALRPLGHN